MINNPNSLQCLIDYAYEYSKKWCFTFNHKKCAVLIYGRKLQKCEFRLGDKIIEVCEKYNHLGIPNRTQFSLDSTYVSSNINNTKFAFYSLIGSSLRKTKLSIQVLT